MAEITPEAAMSTLFQGANLYLYANIDPSKDFPDFDYREAMTPDGLHIIRHIDFLKLSAIFIEPQGESTAEVQIDVFYYEDSTTVPLVWETWDFGAEKIAKPIRRSHFVQTAKDLFKLISPDLVGADLLK